MNFRSEVFTGASRPGEAMVWNNEIESAKCVADLKLRKLSSWQSSRQTSRSLILK